METILQDSSNMSFAEKIYWIRDNYKPMDFEKIKIQKKLKQHFDFLVLFSNGRDMACGSLIYGISISNNIPTLKLLSVSADDVFGGGPTQRVIDNFLEYGIDEVFKITGYSKIVFKLEDVTIFKKTVEKFIIDLKEYHEIIYEKLVIESEQSFGIYSHNLGGLLNDFK